MITNNDPMHPYNRDCQTGSNNLVLAIIILCLFFLNFVRKLHIIFPIVLLLEVFFKLSEFP